MRSPSPPPSLVVRLPNWVGDVILSLPALGRLQAAGLALSLVGKRWAGPLLAGQGWTVATLPAGTGARIRLLRELRNAMPTAAGLRLRPDALLLTNSFSSALEARLAGLHPLGYRQDGRGWLLSPGVAPAATGHESVRFDRLARALLEARAPVARSPARADAGSPGRSGASAGPGDPAAPRDPAGPGDPVEPEGSAATDEIDTLPRLALAPDAIATAEALLHRHLGAGRLRFACLVPFATGTLDGAGKAWPGFPAFATELARRLPVIVVPGPTEIDAAREHYAACTRLEQVDMGVYAALLARAAVVVANDTGPAHVAAAVGAPLVSVLGPTDASRYRPLGPDVTLIQARPWPTIDSVRSAVAAVLARGTRAAP